MIRIAATGHRLDRLGGYSDAIFARLVALGKASLKKLEASEVISGMGLGFDQAIAAAAVELSIPLIAAVPFAKQDSKWQPEDRDRYEALLFQTQKIIFVDQLQDYQIVGLQPREYHPLKMFKRNEWMVDNCDHILALFDGSENGGTFNCLKYAEKKEKPILNTWNSWVRHSGV